MAVGCGPLENLIHQHGDALIDDIEQRARRSASFAQALSVVWLAPGYLTPATRDRLQPLISQTGTDG